VWDFIEKIQCLCWEAAAGCVDWRDSGFLSLVYVEKHCVFLSKVCKY
jgi:hypothetical protein